MLSLVNVRCFFKMSPNLQLSEFYSTKIDNLQGLNLYMKQFRYAYLFYPLPLVFIVLTGSANLSGPRIGQTLGTTLILFTILGYLHSRKSGTKGWPKKLVDVLLVILVSSVALAGKNINLEFSFLIYMWPLLASVHPKQSWMQLFTGLLQVIVLFCLIYFGINQYSVDNLLNLKILWLFVVFSLQYFFIMTQFNRSQDHSEKKEPGVGYLVAITGLALYSSLVFDPGYLVGLIVLSAPSSYILFKLFNVAGKSKQAQYVKWFRISSLVSLTIFDLYLFLDSTQVLQAVMGGY